MVLLRKWYAYVDDLLLGVDSSMTPGNERLLEILLNAFIDELKANERCTCRECLGGYIQDFLERDVE